MSKYWLDWNSWGTGEIKDLSDRIEPIGGGLCKKTENMGDGRWCEKCRKLGKYSWLLGGKRFQYREDLCPGKLLKRWHD